MVNFVLITTANDVGVKSKNISNYQNWFEKYTSNPQNANFSIGKNIRGKIEPIWDKAIQIDNHLLELPFKLDGKVLSQNISNGYQDGKVSLILRANTNGSYKGFVTVLSPKSDFVTPLDNINIHNFKTQKFAGIISIYDLRGKYLDGYFVKNGKILGKIGDNSVQRGKASNNSLDMCCSEFCESIEIEWCTCGCWGPNPSCREGNSCTPPVCETRSGGVWCYYECYDCGGGDDCPDPQNPNCDDCPNPMNPNCDDGGGGCFDGNCDDQVLPDDEYICNSNFSFTAINEATSMKQQAAISGLNAKLEYMSGGIKHTVTVNMPTLYFAVDFHGSDGSIHATPEQAAQSAADVVNLGERIMRRYFAGLTGTPIRNATELANIWYQEMQGYCAINSFGYEIDISKNGRLISEHTPIIKPYVPCN